MEGTDTIKQVEREAELINFFYQFLKTGLKLPVFKENTTFVYPKVAPIKAFQNFKIFEYKASDNLPLPVNHIKLKTKLPTTWSIVKAVKVVETTGLIPANANNNFYREAYEIENLNRFFDLRYKKELDANKVNDKKDFVNVELRYLSKYPEWTEFRIVERYKSILEKRKNEPDKRKTGQPKTLSELLSDKLSPEQKSKVIERIKDIQNESKSAKKTAITLLALTKLNLLEENLVSSGKVKLREALQLSIKSDFPRSFEEPLSYLSKSNNENDIYDIKNEKQYLKSILNLKSYVE